MAATGSKLIFLLCLIDIATAAPVSNTTAPEAAALTQEAPALTQGAPLAAEETQAPTQETAAPTQETAAVEVTVQEQNTSAPTPEHSAPIQQSPVATGGSAAATEKSPAEEALAHGQETLSWKTSAQVEGKAASRHFMTETGAEVHTYSNI